LSGDASTNVLFGGKGNDYFIETVGGDYFFGGAGLRDTLVLSNTNSILSLQTGTNNKNMKFSSIEDVIANSGADTITGNTAANEITGRAGNDVISGFGGNDILAGNQGRDSIFGGRGNDTIIGGQGSDTLLGGEGRNTFQYFTPAEGGDVIGDFKATPQSGDIIALRANSFGKLAKGQLDEAHLAVRQGDNFAQEADDRFIYRNSDSTLWFDLDGTGKLPATLLAKLEQDEKDEEATFTASLIWLF
jgi:Ca2+-binding RTX toxin-like protein